MAETHPAERFHEGWRMGRGAAAQVLFQMEGEAPAVARGAVAAMRDRIRLLDAPPVGVALPRADRLQAAISAAVALLRNDCAAEALAVLEDAAR
jgi:hypothetical protein